jgi:hypothetical protein
MRYLGIAAVALLAIEAFGADAEGKYSISSRTSCGKYIEERKQISGVHYAQTSYWVSGYITAYNAWMPDTYDITGDTDQASVMLWLENWCKANPLKNVSNGMELLILEMRPHRHRANPSAR